MIFIEIKYWQIIASVFCQHYTTLTKGSCRHEETWWWNEEVAEAVREKKIKCGKWKKENTNEARRRRVDKMQRGLSLQQRKRNRRNVQMT